MPSDETLFDPSRYGPERTVRRKPEQLPRIKLRPPWVLVRHLKKAPLAHLAHRRYLNSDNTPMICPDCDHKRGLNVLSVQGEPMVEACRDCLKLAKDRGIEVA